MTEGMTRKKQMRMMTRTHLVMMQQSGQSVSSSNCSSHSLSLISFTSFSSHRLCLWNINISYLSFKLLKLYLNVAMEVNIDKIPTLPASLNVQWKSQRSIKVNTVHSPSYPELIIKTGDFLSLIINILVKWPACQPFPLSLLSWPHICDLLSQPYLLYCIWK